MKNKFLKTISAIAFAAIFLGTISILPACHSATQKTETADSAVIPQVHALVPIDTTLKNGIITDKYENGVMMQKGGYNNGKKEGQFDAWYKSGKPWSEGFFKDDLPDGKSTVWYENGKTKYTGLYKMGKQIGHWTYYDETGKVTAEKDYGK